MRRFAALIAITVMLLAALPAVAQPQAQEPAAEDIRDPTRIEEAYVGLALDLKNPTVCAKISPNAKKTDRMQLRGRQVFYTRSFCFMHLAIQEKKPEYCSAVHQAPDGFMAQGWFYAPGICKRMASDPEQKPVLAYGLDYEIVMRMLGYIESERRGRSWGQFYSDIHENQDKSLPARLRKMPDFSKSQLIVE